MYTRNESKNYIRPNLIADGLLIFISFEYVVIVAQKPAPARVSMRVSSYDVLHRTYMVSLIPYSIHRFIQTFPQELSSKWNEF